jgi:hypothetical protein
MSAWSIAKALPGSVRSGTGFLCRCPVHIRRSEARPPTPPPDAGFLAMPPDLGDDWLQRFTHQLERVQVLREGVLRPTDLRTRPARTGRSSTPRASQ